MRVFTPEISWHERDPIYTCAFHPSKTAKFATGGVTGIIRLWEITDKTEKETSQLTTGLGSNSDIKIDFVANLKRHTKSVNVVRWSYDGTVLASAGDEAVIFLWKENDIKNQKTLDNDEDENKENWFSFKCFRGHLEDILDISWSTDGNTLISGSVDNSVIVWNVLTGAKTAIVKEPKGFVQGVVYDPAGVMYACLSTDRSLRVFSVKNNKCLLNVKTLQFSTKELNKEPTDQQQVPHIRMYHDDTMKSFFRRMSFSSDGNLLFTPAGCLDIEMKTTNVSFIYKKNSYNRPCLYLPHDKPSVAISVCPLKFELHERNASIDKVENIFSLPYRYIFAIATEDSVYFYDTENLSPYAFVTGIHYSNLSDISWSNNGTILTVASIDGFCSFIVFNESELGKVYHEVEKDSIQAISTEKKPTTVENIEMNTVEMKSDEREQLKDETALSECIVLDAKVDKKDENKKANTKRIKLIPLA